MKIGIIGTGRHGVRYANHVINDIDGLELCAVSRRSEYGKELASNWNARYYKEWPDLVADRDVEAVIAATPPHINLAIAERCASEGKPLLIEKPLAMNKQDAEQIVNLFEQRNLPLTVGQTLRYNSTIKALQKHFNRIGNFYSFYGC